MVEKIKSRWRFSILSSALGQVICFLLLFGLIGIFSNSPAYQRYDQQQTMLKLSLRHAGQRLGECQQRSAEELAKLPATAHAPQICPRERSPLLLEMLLDGNIVYSEQLPPRGLHNDGLSSTYYRLPLDAGVFDLEVRMKDHLQQTAFPYRLQQRIELRPAQVLVIDFDVDSGQFVVM